MFAYVKGTLVSANSNQLVIDVNGIGYAIFIPTRILQELPPIHQSILLHTTFIVRELSQALYGFLTTQERDFFDLLINVTGVGPKLGLSLIGHLTFDQLLTAVSSQDFSTLCKVPGVGKKTAERLCVELKDKLPQATHLSTLGSCSSFSSDSPLSYGHPFHSHALALDAMHALINLGYQQGVAQKAIRQSVKDLPEDADLALLITTSLKNVK